MKPVFIVFTKVIQKKHILTCHCIIKNKNNNPKERLTRSPVVTQFLHPSQHIFVFLQQAFFER